MASDRHGSGEPPPLPCLQTPRRLPGLQSRHSLQPAGVIGTPHQVDIRPAGQHITFRITIMSEIKHILILANSERSGGRCVAGKLATPLADGTFNVSQQWIRLNNPRGANEGAVPYMDTACRPNRTTVRPLDFIQVALLDP